MKRVKLIGLMIVLGLTFACKKTELPEISGENAPIYFLEGEINGEKIDFEIDGVENTIVFGTDTKQHIPTFYGEMTDKTSGMKFKLEMFRTATMTDGPFSSLVQNQEKEFIVHPIAEMYYNFQGMGNQDKYMQIQNVLGVFESRSDVKFKEYGHYNKRIRFADYEGVEFDLLVNHGFVNRKLDAYFESQGNDSILFLTSPNNSVQHKWYINDSLVGSGQFYYGNIQDGIYHVRHSVTNQHEEEESYETLIRIKGGQHFWQMRGFYKDNDQIQKDNFGKVEYSVYKDGEWFTSAYANSNLTNKMMLDSVVQHYPNGKTEPYALFKFQTDVVVYNESKSDSLILSNLQGVSGVAIK